MASKTDRPELSDELFQGFGLSKSEINKARKSIKKMFDTAVDGGQVTIFYGLDDKPTKKLLEQFAKAINAPKSSVTFVVNKDLDVEASDLYTITRHGEAGAADTIKEIDPFTGHSYQVKKPREFDSYIEARTAMREAWEHTDIEMDTVVILCDIVMSGFNASRSPEDMKRPFVFTGANMILCMFALYRDNNKANVKVFKGLEFLSEQRYVNVAIDSLKTQARGDKMEVAIARLKPLATALANSRAKKSTRDGCFYPEIETSGKMSSPEQKAALKIILTLNQLLRLFDYSDKSDVGAAVRHTFMSVEYTARGAAKSQSWLRLYVADRINRVTRLPVKYRFTTLLKPFTDALFSEVSGDIDQNFVEPSLFGSKLYLRYFDGQDVQNLARIYACLGVRVGSGVESRYRWVDVVKTIGRVSYSSIGDLTRLILRADDNEFNRVMAAVAKTIKK